ncbi:MAG: SlyX family protein [Proteobacteria bacterium]|nr:SlyX family protein [Pseudomonadota bacterium]
MTEEERLIDIETKIAFQERTIKELNDVVYDQQKQIDKLNDISNALAGKIKELFETATDAKPPANEKPPHY